MKDLHHNAAPTQGRVITILILLSLFLGLGIQKAPSALANHHSIPLNGSFSGVGATFAGQLTHLGRFQGLIDNTTIPPTAVWTAANGDTVTNKTLTFEIHFDQPVAPNVYRYTQTLEITGGSGRFSQAMGSATVRGTINIATFAYDGVLQGHISGINQGER